MASVKTEGIVLRKFPYSESSLVVCLFTRECGRVKIAVRGVRRQNSRFAGSLELFSRNEFVLPGTLGTGREIHGLSDCSVLQPFSALRFLPARFAAASYCCEVLDGILQLEDREEALYDWFLHFLGVLETAGTPMEAGKLVRQFELQALQLLGLIPEIGQCRSCGGIGAALLSLHHGGLICPGCSGGGRAITPGTLKVARILSETDPAGTPGLRISGAQARELRELGQLSVDSVLGKKIKSREFLEHILNTEPPETDIDEFSGSDSHA